MQRENNDDKDDNAADDAAHKVIMPLCEWPLELAPRGKQDEIGFWQRIVCRRCITPLARSVLALFVGLNVSFPPPFNEA